MKIGVGIDTGGTYTDAVVYDFENKKILHGGKALTTKEDLSIGIGNVLDAIPLELAQKADLFALSTTLATNACVEDKGGRAKLALLGVSEKIVRDVGDDYGLLNVDDIYFQNSYTTLSGEVNQAFDWRLFEENAKDWPREYDGLGIVELNAISNGAFIEKEAKSRLNSNPNFHIVCGHELFSELNAIKRGVGALLNARLVPIVGEFLKAIKTSMQRRNIKAPIVIVRSDGSLMSEEFTNTHPVETLLCGPASSVMGAAELVSHVSDSVIVDMGGTTTDIALIRGGEPVKSADGIQVGKWRTLVKGLYIDTFGLGGDSAIRYHGARLYLDVTRVVPLCMIAQQYPYVVEQLAELSKSERVHTRFLHEYYMLLKDIGENANYTEQERAFCAQLKDGPLMLEQAAQASKTDVYNLAFDRLEQEGVIIRCGLTPTDIMHLKGDFSTYDRRASEYAAQYVANCLGIQTEQLCDLVYDEIKRKLFCNIVRILLENQNKRYRGEDNSLLNMLINDAYENAKRGERGFLNVVFETPARLVGIGAPIHVFLHDVAKLLGTEAIIPEYARIANALGAVVGNITASHAIRIKPDVAEGSEGGYVVFGSRGRQLFEEWEDAVSFASSEAKEQAIQEAVNRGARGDVTINIAVEEQTGQAKDFDIFLEATVTANAVGRIVL
ncbi:MAG: hydantoinase/oxoprolinase family protein [Christensenellales bacterium]|jgi:N-methylhydantoinase A/oxoprolinase/acetone carboxylase beta subunit